MTGHTVDRINLNHATKPLNKMAGITNRIPFGISDNNNNGLRQSRGGPPNHHIPAGKHCKILEEFIKRQNAELSHKRRVQEEMKSLIDWLKKDLCEAEERVRTLERENGQKQEEKEDGRKNGQKQEEEEGWRKKNGQKQEEEKGTERIKEGEEADDDVKEKIKEKRRGTDGEKEELELLQQMLLEKNGKISKMEETIDNYEREIEDLRRENETYFAQVKTLRTTIQKQAQDLKTDKRAEEELEGRLKDLLAINESLNVQLSQ